MGSRERPKPPLVPPRKVEDALERDSSHSWAGGSRPPPSALWARRAIMKSAELVGEIPEQNEKQLGRYEEGQRA